MADPINCRNCGHTHPSVTKNATTQISNKCDQCECVAHRFSRVEHSRTARSIRVDQIYSDETPGAVATVEHAELKRQALDLRQQIIEQHTRLTTEAREAKAKHALIAQTLTQLGQLAKQLHTITQHGYSSHTHAAVAEAAASIHTAIEAALSLAGS